MKRIFFLSIMLQVVLLMYPLSSLRMRWQYENFSTIEDVKSTSIKLDREDRPHLCCIANGCLYYAHWTGANWEIEVIDEDIGLVMYHDCSLVLDRGWLPHISYYDGKNQCLKSTRFDGQTWITTIVDSEGDVGLYNSVAVDHEGNTYIAYYDATNGNLKYAHDNGSSWEIEIVDTFPNIGKHCALNLDNLSHPHIVYQSCGRDWQGVKYAYWDGSVWHKQMLVESAPGDSSGSEISFVLDNNGYPHIAYKAQRYVIIPPYQRVLFFDLCYFYWNGVAWITDSPPQIIEYIRGPISIVLDALGNPHITCNRGTTVYYAHKAGNQWILNAFAHGSDSSLSITGSGTPFICHSSGENDICRLVWDRTDLWYDFLLSDRDIQPGDHVTLECRRLNRGNQPVIVEEYLFLNVCGEYWFWPDWSQNPHSSIYELIPGFPRNEVILDFIFPPPAIDLPGIQFWGGFLEPETGSLLAYDMVEVDFK